MVDPSFPPRGEDGALVDSPWLGCKKSPTPARLGWHTHSLLAALQAPIHDAARDGDLQRVTAVLDAGGNVNRKDWVRSPPRSQRAPETNSDAAPHLCVRQPSSMAALPSTTRL